MAGGFALYRRLKSAGNAGMTQYKLSTVDTGEVKKTVSATGTLQAWRTVDIKSRAGGEVKKLPVEVGTVVTKGQILAYIDPTDSKLAVNQAAADLESSSAKVQQADKLTLSYAEPNGSSPLFDPMIYISLTKGGVRSVYIKNGDLGICCLEGLPTSPFYGGGSRELLKQLIGR